MKFRIYNDSKDLLFPTTSEEVRKDGYSDYNVRSKIVELHGKVRFRDYSHQEGNHPSKLFSEGKEFWLNSGYQTWIEAGKPKTKKKSSSGYLPTGKWEDETWEEFKI